MLFLFRSAPEVEKRIHSKLFRKFWRNRGTKEPAYITVMIIFRETQVRLSPRIRILLPGQFLIPATAFVSIYTLVLMALDRCGFSSEKHNL